MYLYILRCIQYVFLCLRCIRPNSADKLGFFSRSMVENQLRYSGLLELAKLRRIGFPVRIPYEKFRKT